MEEVIYYDAGTMVVPIKKSSRIDIDLKTNTIFIDEYYLYTASISDTLFLLEEIIYIMEENFNYPERISLNKKEVTYDEVVDYMANKYQAKIKDIKIAKRSKK